MCQYELCASEVYVYTFFVYTSNVWYRMIKPNKYCRERETEIGMKEKERKLEKRDFRFHINLHFISKQT